jgi:hypothetical protein
MCQQNGNMATTLTKPSTAVPPPDSIAGSRTKGGAKSHSPPDFTLKRLGSDERVRLSSFQGKRPVALVFGSYT